MPVKRFLFHEWQRHAMTLTSCYVASQNLVTQFYHFIKRGGCRTAPGYLRPRLLESRNHRAKAVALEDYSGIVPARKLNYRVVSSCSQESNVCHGSLGLNVMWGRSLSTAPL